MGSKRERKEVGEGRGCDDINLHITNKLAIITSIWLFWIFTL